MGKKKEKEKVSRGAVKRALKRVMDPELGKDLVSLGMVKDLRVKGSRVALTVVLTTPACPLKAQIQEAVVREVRKVPGVETVEVTFGASVPRGRQIPGKEAIPGVKNTIAIASGKGGVGKSTVSVNVAIALAESGAKVGLLDADIYGPNIPTMMGIREEPVILGERIKPLQRHGVRTMSLGFFLPPDTPVLWRGPMVMRALQQLLWEVDWGDLDYLIIDLPPGTGDAQITLIQSIPLTGAVIVTTPQDVALEISLKGLQMFQKVGVPILGIVENMSYFVCPYCQKRTEIFSHGGGARASEKMGVPFLGEIPIDPEIRAGGDEGNPIVQGHPESDQAEAFRALACALSARISTLSLETASGDPTA
jgi:ATP-binding protein involved in chromosome partitioning